jgi:hypothetical protein
MRQIESDGWATSEVVGKRLDLDRDSVRKALLALRAADYIDEEAASGHIVQNVSAEARRELGVWPTPETLTEQLAAAFEAEARSEKEPGRKKVLLARLPTASARWDSSCSRSGSRGRRGSERRPEGARGDVETAAHGKTSATGDADEREGAWQR